MRASRRNILVLSTAGALWLALAGAAAGQGAPDSPPLGNCAASPTTLCLHDHRFEVSVSWRTEEGLTGQGMAVRLSDDTGYFWFFDQGNVELVVKVLAACTAPFDRYWVFSSGLTNVEVALLVTDTETSDTKLYVNPLGRTYLPTQDTQAFACP